MKEWKSFAEQGDADAQHIFALRYRDGEVVLQDMTAAHMWFNISAANGYAKAAETRDIAAGKLTA